MFIQMNSRKLFLFLIFSQLFIFKNSSANTNLEYCQPKILTFSFGADGNPAKPVWIIEGSCFEKVTNIFLAKDFGDGLENIPFKKIKNIKKKISIIVPHVNRKADPYGSQSTEYYLLQIRSCDSQNKNNCEILDEKLIPYKHGY